VVVVEIVVGAVLAFFFVFADGRPVPLLLEGNRFCHGHAAERAMRARSECQGDTVLGVRCYALAFRLLLVVFRLVGRVAW
jgi:hypothetical protein